MGGPSGVHVFSLSDRSGSSSVEVSGDAAVRILPEVC